MKTFLLVGALLLLVVVAIGTRNEKSGNLIEGFGWRPRRYGGGYRRGPVYFGPSRYRYGPYYGNICDCHYYSGHVSYAGGKCYRPWGSRIDPRDPCY
jgi:hypothetical protein